MEGQDKKGSIAAGEGSKARLKARSKSSKNGKSSRKRKITNKVFGKKEREPKVIRTASQKAWESAQAEILAFLRTHWVLSAVVVAISMLLGALYFAVDVLEKDQQLVPPVTDVVRFQFAKNGTYMGFVDFGLFGSTCPLTTKNFILLATHEKGYGYKGSRIHMILPMHAILGGDITKGDGSGGRSALGRPFERENFQVRHAGPGYLGMKKLENNRDSNKSSIFYVTTHDVPSFDHVNVAFGMVLAGMDVIKNIQNSKVDNDMAPKLNITIIESEHWKATY